MNVYVRVFIIAIGSHVIKWAAEYAYFTQCAGFWNSIFSWNSPVCIGLRWTADSVMTNAVAMVGGYSMQLLAQGTNSQ